MKFEKFMVLHDKYFLRTFIVGTYEIFCVAFIFRKESSGSTNSAHTVGQTFICVDAQWLVSQCFYKLER